MRNSLYFKLALEGMKKNKRLYKPYLFTCIMMAVIFYIISFLSKSELLASMPGGDSTKMVLAFGAFVVAVFACIFLFYTNAFLIRRRKKEFGIYNVLGMNKRGICRILFLETLMTYVITMILGLFFGILLSKFVELGLINIIGGSVSFSFSVNPMSIEATVGLFAIMFLLILLNSYRQIRFVNPLSLMKSENEGEKPPKGNWFLGLLGAAILVAAYVISVRIKQPVEALSVFFIAVIMVIIGTFMVLISGSVLFCNILKKNKKFYYNPKHFVSVSSMAYRMKRNGAGLASICILLTIVLVIMSSTTCLYFGREDCVKMQYPRDICTSLTTNSDYENCRGRIDQLLDATMAEAGKAGASVENEQIFEELYITGILEGDTVELVEDMRSLDAFVDYSNLCTVQYISQDDYNRMYGKQVSLGEGEAILCQIKAKHIQNKVNVGNVSYTIVDELNFSDMDFDQSTLVTISPNIYLIVRDLKEVEADFANYKSYDGENMLYWKWICRFDTDAEGDDQIALQNNIKVKLLENLEGMDNYYLNCDNSVLAQQDFYGSFGGLFFLGILLSIIFLTAAVLIIYYKQISEGYEDQARFDIMQRVGMTKRDIRRSINSQMLTVFYIPIVLAVMHICFAFPVINKLLMLFSLYNVRLFIETTGITVLTCVIFYGIVYKVTSNAYYSIVSE